jgi:hypothetical protein
MLGKLRPANQASARLPGSDTGPLYRSSFYSKSLTNYFIASNQIVKQLRRQQGDSGLLRKTPLLPASKAVWVTSVQPTFFGANAFTQKRSGKLFKPGSLELLQDCLRTTMESKIGSA